MRLLNLARSTGNGDARELREAAEQAGFEPGGEFGAWMAPLTEGRTGPHGPDGWAARLQTRLDLLSGTHAVGQERGAVVVLVQDGDADRVADAFGRQGLTCVAVGLVRTGDYAVRESLRDARAAAVVARGRAGLWEFAELWPMALALGAGERVEPLLGPVAEVARRHPHLAEAVRAFTDYGFTVSSAARSLTVHPNTLSYRLKRWKELTGVEVRTVTGLVASRTAVELVARERQTGGSAISSESRNSAS
ncbi:helix-turn-helix domain-containing protein [Streptomyces violaceusniger]